MSIGGSSAILKKADAFAAKAHFGQIDRAGKPYIDHPRTVASWVDDETEKVVALLHDVVEDTEVSLDEIRVEFGDEVAEAIRVLTRPDGVSYMDYIRGIKKNEIARKVKLADLRHNMDLTRIQSVSEEDFKRVKKYKKAYDVLSN